MALAPPRSLTPTKVSSFTSCPLAFRLAVIDRLPEPPAVPAVKGTLVHSALEGLHWNHPPGRRSEAAAQAELDVAWAKLRRTADFLGLGLDDEGAEAFVSDAADLVRNYFQLEDPDRVRSVGVELCLESELDHLRLRGVIDRLDVTDDGELVVVDYKTGKAPSERFEHAKLGGVHTYALLCERVLGRTPVAVRLLFLREPVELIARPSGQTIRGQRQRTVAVWRAIERACATEDFRPRPSALCRFCNFQPLCPAQGGSLPSAAPAC